MNGREGLTAAPSSAPCRRRWPAVRQTIALLRTLRALLVLLRGALPGHAHRDRQAGPQAVRSVHHHAGAGRRAAVEDGQLALGQGNFDGLDLRHGVALGVLHDGPHKGALHAGLDGRRGHHDGVGAIFHLQVNVDELVGEQGLVLVVEDGLELGGARSGVDLVVSGEQLAGGDMQHVAAVEGVHA